MPIAALTSWAWPAFRDREILRPHLEAVSKLFEVALAPKKLGYKAQRAGLSCFYVQALQRRERVPKNDSWGVQPEGPTPFFAHFRVARRSLTPGQPHSSRLELRENTSRRDLE